MSVKGSSESRLMDLERQVADLSRRLANVDVRPAAPAQRPFLGMLGKTDAAIADGASGVVSIWTGTPGGETDTGVNVAATNKLGSTIALGAWVWLEHNGNGWYILSPAPRSYTWGHFTGNGLATINTGGVQASADIPLLNVSHAMFEVVANTVEINVAGDFLIWGTCGLSDNGLALGAYYATCAIYDVTSGITHGGTTTLLVGGAASIGFTAKFNSLTASSQLRVGLTSFGTQSEVVSASAGQFFIRRVSGSDNTDVPA